MVYRSVEHHNLIIDAYINQCNMAGFLRFILRCPHYLCLLSFRLISNNGKHGKNSRCGVGYSMHYPTWQNGTVCLFLVYVTHCPCCCANPPNRMLCITFAIPPPNIFWNLFKRKPLKKSSSGNDVLKKHKLKLPEKRLTPFLQNLLLPFRFPLSCLGIVWIKQKYQINGINANSIISMTLLITLLMN